MSYAVKEIFYTMQGEGARAGNAAVFVRFSGCNLWSGREQDRATASCRFCDTDFIGGERMAATEIARKAASFWPGAYDGRFVVLTGGEPLLQVDAALIQELKRERFEVAIETNGTLPGVTGIDWMCVSPKAGADLVHGTAEELKLVFPQPGLMPDKLTQFQTYHRWLSPMAGPDLAENTRAAIAYCLMHPEWKLTMQHHKVWGIA